MRSGEGRKGASEKGEGMIKAIWEASEDLRSGRHEGAIACCSEGQLDNDLSRVTAGRSGEGVRPDTRRPSETAWMPVTGKSVEMNCESVEGKLTLKSLQGHGEIATWLKKSFQQLLATVRDRVFSCLVHPSPKTFSSVPPATLVTQPSASLSLTCRRRRFLCSSSTDDCGTGAGRCWQSERGWFGRKFTSELASRLDGSCVAGWLRCSRLPPSPPCTEQTFRVSKSCPRVLLTPTSQVE
eukprot:766856-Hanusia_phi.AAC.2